MKLAYSSNAYRMFSLPEAIDRIASLGYGAVEIMADLPHAWPPETGKEQIASIRTALDRTDIAISNVNAFMMNAVQDFWHPSWIEADEAFRQQRVQHTAASLKMAAALGAPSITTEPGGPLDPGVSWDWGLHTFVAGLEQVLPMAEELGVQLLVEPEPELLIENSDQFLELAKKIDSPAFGLNFDIGHFFCVGDPLPETVHKLQEWTRHYHVEDIAANRVHEHLVPGRGAVDFSATFQAILDTNFTGWMTVELYPYLDDPDAAGAEAKAHLQWVIQNLSVSNK